MLRYLVTLFTMVYSLTYSCQSGEIEVEQQGLNMKSIKRLVDNLKITRIIRETKTDIQVTLAELNALTKCTDQNNTRIPNKLNPPNNSK